MGSTLILALFAMLPGCSTSPTTDDVAEKPARPKQGRLAKNKAGKAGKGAKTGKRGKAQPPGGPSPIGVAGPATAELKLVQTEAPAPAPVPAPAPDAPGTPPAQPAPPARGGTSTQATVSFAFSDGSTQDVSVGEVPGTCTETDPQPIGPEGKQQTPLWSFQCVDGETTIDLAIAQIGQALSILRAPEAPEGAAPQYRIVKRVRLVPGVTLTKKQG